MEQYIPKSVLTAEIERIKEMYCYDTKTNASFVAEAVINSINNAIDTLEVKEVDLEEKATQLSQKYFPDEENIWARPNIEAQKCKSACIEMVEWFKAQKGEEV